jgi:multidrug efflux pump subunit AcrA (membrane-fusion protein)
VDELNIRSVQPGAMAEIRVDAFPNAALAGVVRKIDAQAEAGSFSKIGVQIDILDPQGLDLKPNLTAQCHILGGQIPQVLSLPTEAIKTEGADRVICVIGPDGRIKKRPVRTGRVAGNRVEVTEGLKEGERVAVSEVDFLREGEQVRAKPGGAL